MLDVINMETAFATSKRAVVAESSQLIFIIDKDPNI